MNKRLRTAAIVVAMVLAGAAVTATRAADRLVVVELFTSQACGSCPPADKLAGELARRDDLLVLSFHVDYWDYTGWKDPYAISEATERQKGYGESLKRRYVYTPQIVVDGEKEIPGSRLETVRPTIAAALERSKLTITIDHNPADGVAEVRIPAAPHRGPPADVWVAIYDNALTTDIEAGENKGRRLKSVNVVRMFQRIGAWRGEELALTLPLTALGSTGHDGCAILVQKAGYGRILGAKSITLPGRAS